MIKKVKFIPNEIYGTITKYAPIFCVDIVINTKKGVLLGKRKNEPVKGRIWFIGGRVWFGERLEEAAVRKTMEETGLKIKIRGFVGLYSTMFPATATSAAKHTINAVYYADAVGGALKKESQHSEFVFVNAVKGWMHPYLKQALSDSGVFSKSAKHSTRKTYEFSTN